MAKVKFREYLRKKKNSGPVYESGEGLVKRAKKRMEADELIVQPAYRIENYEKAADLLEQAGDYPGAQELRRECLDKAELAKAEKTESDYRRAVLHLEEADSEEDLAKVSREFKKLKGYKDSGELKKKADDEAGRLRKRFRLKQAVVIVIIILLAFCAAAGAKAGLFSYLAARLEGRGGIYESAYSRFVKLGDFLDSEEQAARYKDLMRRQKERNESKSVKKGHKGDTVRFGDYSWTVLERSGSARLLLCQTPKEDIFLSHISYDGDMKVISETEEEENAQTEQEDSIRGLYDEVFSGPGQDTVWAESSLRSYLNTEVLGKAFSEFERGAMLPMDTVPGSNGIYGTDGGAETTDLIRLLSLEEAENYQKIFEKPNQDTWLCTPGHDGTSAAYMTKSGVLMPYGNDVRSESLSVCPVILVDADRLTAE
jgi:hypothetical protein